MTDRTPTDTEGKAPADGRDAQGRFTAGNAGGPGGPKRRAFTLRQAASEAITPEHLQAMLRKAAAMALQGNLSAMRFVFERVCGKAPEAPATAEPLGIVLPAMQTAAECNQALERITHAICAGTLERDVAKLLIDAVQARLKAIEVHDLEQRLADLEESAAKVEMPSNGRRRA
jgi:hypothetical protein